jgi:hypothetical protein
VLLERVQVLEQRLLRLRIKGECQRAPEAAELEELTGRSEDPLIARVAQQLQQELGLQLLFLPPHRHRVERVACCVARLCLPSGAHLQGDHVGDYVYALAVVADPRGRDAGPN